MIELGTVVQADPIDTNAKGANLSFLGYIDTASRRVRVVIKDLTEKQIANEMVAAALCNAVGLRVPPTYLASVDSTEFTDFITGPIITGSHRLAFGSEEVGEPPLLRRFVADDRLVTPAILERIAHRLLQWPDFPTAVAFDEWIANVDRHLKNLLWDSKQTFWMIDHDRAFTGPSWDSSTLIADAEYVNKLIQLVSGLRPSASQKTRFTRSATALGEKIHSLGIDKLLTSSCDAGKDVLIEDERTALESFLRSRVDRIHSGVAAKLGEPVLSLPRAP